MTHCFAEATHSYTRYWTDASVNVRGPKWPWQRTAGCALLLSLLATTDFQTAHAGAHCQGVHFQGVHFQGVHFQGVHFQGVHFQGTALHAGLQGQQLVVARERADGVPVRIEISSFRGDRVAVRLHGPSAREVGTTEIHPTALVGATWSAESCDDDATCREVTYRIVDVVRDRSTNTMIEHADNRDVWLYEIEYVELGSPGAVNWTPVCGGNAGHTAGLFVDGLWHSDGAHDDEGYTFSCPDGVIAKCVRGWGYKPWKTLFSEEHGEVSLAAVHQMCTRVARADYCGDGNAHTCDGTLIDIFDGYGFNVRDESMPFVAEAGFDQDGARWAERPRWPTGEPWKTAGSSPPASAPPATHPLTTSRRG